jgi:hypothetical protein
MRVDSVLGPEPMPHLIGVTVEAFGDAALPQPEQSVFTTYKHAWLGLPDEMCSFATMPPPRAND